MAEHDGPRSQFSDDVPERGDVELLPVEFFSHLILNRQMGWTKNITSAALFFGLSMAVYKFKISPDATGIGAAGSGGGGGGKTAQYYRPVQRVEVVRQDPGQAPVIQDPLTGTAPMRSPGMQTF